MKAASRSASSRSPLLLLAVTLGFLAAADSSARAQERPNLIYIMADDLGIDWIGCYGADHQTPNIDRLAEQGVRFDNVWCNPICTPTRLTLLTGKYPFRTGWTDHHDVPRWGGKGFDWERHVCWARVLRGAGYATAIGGKWQVNDFRDHPDALARHGFDEHCIWTGYETGNAPPSDERYWDPYLITNGARATHRGEFGPKVINDFLVDFIQRHRDRPFAVYYPLLLPHGPFIPTPDNTNDPPATKKARYAGMVSYVDELVGRIVATVDRLGLAENTFLVFTCDNGSPIGGRRDGKPYPNGKGKVSDVGAHVSFVVRAPFLTGGKVGEIRDDLIDFSDVYPTLVELAGAEMPSGAKFDGRSIVGLVDGSAKPTAKRAWIYSQRGIGRMVRDHRYLLDARGRFFDLRNDPLQKKDLASSDEVAIRSARDRLASVLRSFPADAGPPFTGYREKRALKKK